MKKSKPERTTSRHPEAQRQRALERWDAEGGAAVPPQQAAARPAAEPAVAEAVPEAVTDTSTECQHLHSRLIALENLLIGVLALGNKQQLALASSMADHITARAGTPPHRLTTQAATQMVHLVGRAQWFRSQVRSKADKA